MSTRTIKGYLNHVEIRGFRSLKEVSVELSPLTVLIGSNGAGKSNFLKFFELMHWLMDGRSLKEWVAREGGADDQLFMGSRETEKLFWRLSVSANESQNKYQYEAATNFSNPDQLNLAFEYFRYNKHGEPEASWVELNPSNDRSALPLRMKSEKPDAIRLYAKGSASAMTAMLRQCNVFQFHDTSKHAAIKKLHDITDSVSLNADGGNLAAVLLNLSEYYTKHLQLIERQISRVLPTFAGFILKPQHGKVLLRWRHRNSDKVIGSHLTSDGSLRLFCLITLLNLPKDMLPSIILLDEPELGLHPNAVTLVAAMIRTLSTRCQVILATQSPLMVDNFSLDNVIVADLEEGATRLRELNQKDYQQWLDDDFTASDLWLSNVLGGQP